MSRIVTEVRVARIASVVRMVRVAAAPSLYTLG